MRLALTVCLAVSLTAKTALASQVIHSFDNLALAPFGGKTVDVEKSDAGNLSSDPHGTAVLRAPDGHVLAQYDPCRVCDYSNTAWSPKGDAFAFVASGTGKATIYTALNGKLRAAAQITGTINTLRFSPDGMRIAALVTVRPRKLIGATEAGAALTGEIGAAPDEQRIAIVPMAGGTLKPVSPADTYIYEYDWMPDGLGFAATGAKGNGDNNWWVATLDYVDARSGATRVIAMPKMQMDMPRVSADGKTVAFIGGLMSDWSPVGGDVYSVPIAGGVPADITPRFKGSFNGIAWRGAKILASALIADRAAAVSLDPVSGGVRILWSAPVGAKTQTFDGAIAFSADGRSAATILEDFTHGQEIAKGMLPALVPITHVNVALPANLAAQSVHWKSEDYDVQGWLLGPKRIGDARKHPMVVIIHGGPSSILTPHYIPAALHGTGFDSSFLVKLINRGYYVFYPNDRGSYGQGEAFTRANVKDFGRGDLRDMLAGVDAVEKIAPVDDARLGLYGHSYGGWFAMWANTQTRRFKAFVAGAGIADWTSYYGENGIDQWMIPFFGASVYDDPAVYRASSPIEFIKRAKTPTLLYVGERDVECPAPQSLEYWHALKTLGTPTELYIYAGEGHHFNKRADLEDLSGHISAWFDRYLR